MRRLLFEMIDLYIYRRFKESLLDNDFTKLHCAYVLNLFFCEVDLPTDLYPFMSIVETMYYGDAR